MRRAGGDASATADRSTRPWRVVWVAWVIGAGLLGLLWILAAVAVPRLIRLAYEGEGGAWLSGIIQGRDVHPLGFYLGHWSRIATNLGGFVAAQLVLVLPLVLVGPQLRSRLQRPEPAGRLWSTEGWIQGAALLAVASTLYLYFFAPAVWLLALHEDSWVEWGTSLSFFAAFYFLLFGLVIDPARRRPGYALLAIAAFFVAGEEISWGQRLIGIRSSSFFLEHNVQGETNLHNMLPVPIFAVVGLGVLFWAVGISWMARRSRRVGRWLERLGVPIPPRWLRPLFYATAAFYFLSHAPWLVERFTELGEFFLGLSVAAFSLHLALESAYRTAPDRRASTASTALLLAALGAATWTVIAAVGEPNPSAYLHSFAIRRFPERGLYRQAERMFDYLEAHEPLMSDTTFLEEARFYKSLGRREEAAAAFGRALDAAMREAAARPHDPVPERNLMVIYRLLGRESEASAARAASLSRDSARLAAGSDGPERARIRWSMAITLYKAGLPEAARREIEQACEDLGGQSLPRRVERWTLRHLGTTGGGTCAGFE